MKENFFNFIFANTNFLHYTKDLYCFLLEQNPQDINLEELDILKLDNLFCLSSKQGINLMIDQKITSAAGIDAISKYIAIEGFINSAKFYDLWLKKHEKLRSLDCTDEMIKVPTPRYIVIGKIKDKLQKKIGHLTMRKLTEYSESKNQSSPCEWTSDIYVFGKGDYVNRELCKGLHDYCYVIDAIYSRQEEIIRANPTLKPDTALGQAIDEVLDKCIAQGIFLDVLSEHKDKVKEMLMEEMLINN